MEISEAMALLSDQLKDQEWFYDISIGSSKKLIVYTLWQDMNILQTIPSTIAGYHICVHFAPPNSIRKSQQLDAPEEEDIVEYNINDLTKELDRLERICGSNILQDIFYEVQDGKNAVTNLSSRFPDVRKSMEQLFDRYGFDVIYEEIDG